MNTDGIDPDSCQNVLIEDYVYCAGDDAVAVKSGWNWAGRHVNMSSRNITVRNARSGCRGGFTVGSEMSGGVQGVLFEKKLHLDRRERPALRISSELGRGSFVRIAIRNAGIKSFEKIIITEKFVCKFRDGNGAARPWRGGGGSRRGRAALDREFFPIRHAPTPSPAGCSDSPP